MMSALKSSDGFLQRCPDIPIIESSNTWWIAKVKSRQEKAFAVNLIEKNIEFYLPCYTHSAQRTDCKSTRKSIVPLFPSYVPFALSGEPWFLLQSARVSTIIPVKAQARFKRQLNQIYLINERKLHVQPDTGVQYECGDVVELIDGPLNGLTGRIVNCKGNNYLLVDVDGLGGAIVTIDKNSVVKSKPAC
ncbi:MAG: hypothetical protein GX639_00405 [Fibrobacter sp.]|nr:hypothetical protein [Fibrobacter sp.]